MKKLFLVSSIFCWVLGQSIISPTVSIGDGLSQQTQTERSPEPVSPQVVILDPGSQPRQQLRFTPVVGAKQTVKMRMTIGMNTLVDNKPLPNNTQLTMEVTIDTIVKKIEPNGDIHYNFVYSEASIITQPESVSTGVSELNGLSASIIVDPQGRLKRMYDLVFPEKMSPAMKESMAKLLFDSLSQFSLALPTEAVGIGAKWQIDQVSSMPLLPQGINQNVIFELVKQQDNILTLVMTVRQQATEQKSILPQESSKMPVQIISVDSLGNGKITEMLNLVIKLYI